MEPKVGKGMMPISRAGHWKNNETETGRNGEREKRGNAPIPRFPDSPIRLQTGFTLIELIIVLIVLSAVLVIAFPRMEVFLSGGRLKSTARRLVGTIRYLHFLLLQHILHRP